MSRTCRVCGKLFAAKTNAAYCLDCREDVRSAQRQAATGRWEGRHPERRVSRATQRRWLAYGIGEDEYQARLVAQDHRCAVCRRLFGKSRADWPHVDHDHRTDLVRGLLCPDCNHGLGKFQDSKDLLIAAALYLATA